MKKPTGQEMVIMFKEEKNPVALADKMDDFVNNMSVDLKSFVDALKVEDESVKVRFSTISLFWVKKLSYNFSQKWFDLRNKYSAETCDKIQKILGEDLENFHPGYPGYSDPYSEEDESFEVEFIEKMSRTHRTLQQTFSGLVFLWLAEMQETMEDSFFVNASKKITTNLEEGFHGTPFI